MILPNQFVTFARKFKRKVFKNFFKYPSKKFIENQLLQIRETEKKIFVFPSPGSPWGYLFQRPQQIARTLSSMGYPVIYCVDNNYPEAPDWFVRGIKQLDTNLYLYNDGLKGECLKSIANQIVIWQYWPQQRKVFSNFQSNESIIIYDCLDHLTTFRQYKNIKKDFNISISEADLILATASSIYTNLKITRDDVMLVPNAVALEDFEKTRIYSLSKKDNKILRKIYALKENSEVVVGYYGAIAEWIDFELIEYCAHKNPNWQFIFIGEMYPRIKAASKFNIHYFERVDYYTLPYILECFDISIVPFLLNEITHNTSPVKIFEYMAGGKPIVSTNLPEAMKYRSVLIAGDKIGFEKKLHEALQCKNDQNYRMQLNKDAHNNTWLKRVSHILEVLVERNLLN